MREVSLQEILDTRERRADTQRHLLAQYHLPLLGLNMNIAGPQKRSALVDFAFSFMAEQVEHQLGEQVVHRIFVDEPTGQELLWVCRLSAEELKTLAVEWETATPVGRLCDLDVIKVDGEKLSRTTPRTCLVCNAPVAPCARSRAHGLKAVQTATQQLLQDFATEQLADLAVQALLDEVNFTPKPGLVDCRNNGSHKDMNRTLFHRSAHSLRPYFQQAVQIGMAQDGSMPELQQAGQTAELIMLETTNGINTHKGAIYAFGLALCGIGRSLVYGGNWWEIAATWAVQGIPPSATHGTAVWETYRAGGARAEAIAGFPHGRLGSQWIQEGGAIYALLRLLATVEDTNLLHRGGWEGLTFVQEQAKSILEASPDTWESRLTALDDVCIARNLSPGGCADLLALSLLLSRIHLFKDNP